jgi:3,4-dihydroxy 2-butanone 4-phosphate synthase/GTP cyclohydrolase II
MEREVNIFGVKESNHQSVNIFENSTHDSGSAESGFSSIESAIEAIRAGRMVIVVDDDNRENEGDLVAAADSITPEQINFMVKYARGLVCAPISHEIAAGLGFSLMSKTGEDRQGTAFLVSVDVKDGTTTGISAAERALTIKHLASSNAKYDDFFKPGHVFPLEARRGGVLKRAGHTEAAVDLARLAGKVPAGVICEIMNDDGTMARLPALRIFAKEHSMELISVADLIAWRSHREKLIEKIVTVKLPTMWGEFEAHSYRSVLDDSVDNVHIALTRGEISEDKTVLVRVHSECLTGDVFGSLRCDCGNQLHEALKMISAEGMGVLLYMRHEGRGIGISEKLKAYKLQEEGMDTVDANIALGWKPDLRDYGIGAQILFDLNIRRLRLLTNNPKKIVGLQGYGLEITERIPLIIKPNNYNRFYLDTKERKMGHLLN